MKSPENTLRNLIETLAEVISEDPKLSDEFLLSIGNDPKDVESSGNEFLKRIKGQLRLKIAGEKIPKFNEFKEKFLFNKDKLLDKSKVQIAELLADGNRTAFNTYYRKLENMTENDSKEIQTEQDLLSFLDSLDE
ncbi:MAG TPA: hypothetical protein VFF33_13345 [Ignavibacteriaceae bacterium]|nr:hypothetical protein [Ignavibacteriaceae bacterium]